MKQKNLILVAVAVGCGLVAAVLTSQMSAGTAAVVETVEVPVASKELPMGTWLKKQDIKQYVVYKKFAKDNLPAAFSSNEDEIADKRTARLLRAGEPFNPADLTTNVSIQPPAGMNLMAIPISAAQAAAGFCVPGTRVDVVAAVTMNSMGGKGIIFPLLVDMLVLAVDTQAAANPQGGAMASVGMVSLAVNTDQVSIITAALKRAADLRIILRNPEKPPTWKHVPTEKEIWGIMADDPKLKFSSIGELVEDEEKEQKLKLPVPKEDLPAGTQLTEAVLKEKFTYLEFTPPAPANILADVEDLKGQWLTQGLAANQFVPRNFVGAKPYAKAAPADDSEFSRSKDPVQAPEGPKPAKPAPRTEPVYHDVTIQTTSGVVTYRYEVLPNNEYRYIGPVPNGSGSKPAPAEPKPAAKDAPDAAGDEDDAPSKKPEPKKKPAAKTAPDATPDADDAPAKKADPKKKAAPKA